MSDLIPFQFDQQEVRAITDEQGEPWFVAADVCRILGITKPENAYARLTGAMKDTRIVGTPGGPQQMVVVNEAGLYKLVFTSRKPEAERFTDWVAGEVLPEIRRTGGYNLPKTLPDALRLAADQAEQIERLEAQAKADAPKVEFYEKVRDAEGLFTVSEAAKALGTGEKRLFSLLRGRGYLMRNNLPFQEWIERGWMHVVVKNGRWGGQDRVYRQTQITGRGLQGLTAALADALPPPRSGREDTRPKQQGLPGLLN